MDILRFLLRAYSYLFHIALSTFLFLIALVVVLSGKHNLSLGMLPWTGASLTYWVFWLSLAGILITIAAMTGRFRFLFPLWALFVVIMSIRGYFLSPYHYSGSSHFQQAVYLTVGSIVAFLCSLLVFRRRRDRLR